MTKFNDLFIQYSSVFFIIILGIIALIFFQMFDIRNNRKQHKSSQAALTVINIAFTSLIFLFTGIASRHYDDWFEINPLLSSRPIFIGIYKTSLGIFILIAIILIISAFMNHNKKKNIEKILTLLAITQFVFLISTIIFL